MTPDQIIAARNALQLTQSEAAVLLGVDPRSWRRWEAGSTMPEPAQRLLKVIAASPEALTVAKKLAKL